MSRAIALALMLATVVACGKPAPTPAPKAAPGDAAFSSLSTEILEDFFRRHPSNATDLGIHKYDAVMDKVEDSLIGCGVGSRGV